VASIYTDMQAVAIDMISEFKQGSMVYNHRIGGTSPFDPYVDVEVPFNGVASGVSQKYINDLVTASDIEITASVFVIPNWDDGTLKTSGSDWDDNHIWDDNATWSDDGVNMSWSDTFTWDDNGVDMLRAMNNGTVTIDGEKRQIISTKRIPAAGTPVVLKIFVKG